MEKCKKERKDHEAVIYIAASIPFLIWRLSMSYLHMRRQARREGRLFYQALLRDGVPRKQARDLADIYSSGLSLTQMIRGMRDLTS